MPLAREKLFAPLWRLFSPNDVKDSALENLPSGDTDAPLTAEDVAEWREIEALPVLDMQALDRTRAMMGDKMGVFIELYVKSTHAYLDALRNVAAGVGTATDACIPAHSLKSSSAQVGAMRVAHVCRRIEEQIRTGAATPELIGTVGRLEACCLQVEPHLLRAVD